jgi:carbonic anhydrase/acetyltransferase-like protein (isoleucine patch superfamily)
MFHFPTIVSKTLNQTKLIIIRFITEMGGDLERKGSKLSNDVAFFQILSRHRKLNPFYDILPTIGNSKISENSTLVGDIHVNQFTNIENNVVLRAETAPIRIGSYVFIGDHCSFNTCYTVPPGVVQSINIGNHSIIEPGCIISSCIIDENVLIGARTVIGEGAKIGKNTIIAPNSFVSPGTYIPEGQLWSGSPVRFTRNLNEDERNSIYIKSYELWNKSNNDLNEDMNELETKVNEYTSENYFKWRAKYSL